MAKLKVKVIELVAPISRKEQILDFLQRKGAVEISAPEEAERLRLRDFSEETAKTEKELLLVKNAGEILRKEISVKKPLTAMLEPRIDLTEEQFSELSEKVPETLKFCENIIELNKNREDIRAEIVRKKTNIELLSPWKNADMPLKSGRTQKVSYIFGSFKGKVTRAQLLETLSAEYPERDAYEIEIIYSDDTVTCVSLYCLNEDSEELENTLRNIGFIRAPECPDMKASEKISSFSDEIRSCENEILKCSEKIRAYGDIRERLLFAEDNLSIKRDKLLSLGKIPETERIFSLKGFVAEKNANKICSYLEDKCGAAVDIREPEKNEDVPVILSNNFFAAPLEGITGMYSLPSDADIDPTGIMAFFYYFFFGMMLSDAGYGLIIALATGGLLLFKKNMEKKMKNTLRMYFFCGLSTVFWGAMYGSWFGDAGQVIFREFLGKDFNPLPPLWTDPVNNLMSVLVVCFIFGLVHLFVGVGVKAYADIKRGKKFEAFCDSVPTYLTILGIAPVFFNLFTTVPEILSTIGTPMLIAGLVLVVLTGGRSSKTIGGKIGGGLYEIYNLVGGYLGDVLSYARLLALGLATGVIAQVMNMLGTMPENKTVKLILFIIVFIAGHIVNLAINIIGAYVHTNRLQYVEFFGKFYEGGGRAFVPFKAQTQHYKFKEEN